MSAKRFSRVKKAGAILPLAMISAASAATLPTVATGPVAAPAEQSAPRPIDSPLAGASVPTEMIEAPASVTMPEGASLGPGIEGSTIRQVVATASTSEIPSSALAAYQRAETVINSADNTCNVSWQMIAGIGRVESNHGRFGGNVLNDNGVAEPGIYGIPLNGSRDTAVIRDTDAGQFDNDLEFDRAVGPMQFIPSTWSVLGVDADGDGMRNPQDIDDAALGAAVYLCSGNDNLATDAGQRAALFRYNNSQSYVNLVLEITEAYLDGDFTSVPNDSLAAGFLVGAPALMVAPTPVPPEDDGEDRGQQQGTKDDGRTVDAIRSVEPTSPRGPGHDGKDGQDGRGDGGGRGAEEPTGTDTPVEPTPPAVPEPTTPEPTPDPVTPEPTPDPVTPEPTPDPVTPEPTPDPVTPEPTPDPVTPEPTPDPVTPEPTPETKNPDPVTPAVTCTDEGDQNPSEECSEDEATEVAPVQ